MATRDRVEYSFSFLVAGHAYGAPSWDGGPERPPGIHPPLLNTLEQHRKTKDLVLLALTGDLVRHATEENWELVTSQLSAFDLPFRLAPGNHDSNGEVPYASRTEQTYQYYEFRGHHFFFFDTNISPWKISNAQLQLLREKLVNVDKDEYIFIFVHHLLWWEPDGRFKEFRPNWTGDYPEQTNFYSEVLRVLQDKGQHAYFFAGDVGVHSGYEALYYQSDHFTCIASGIGGNEGDNLLQVRVGNDAVEITVIPLLPNEQLPFAMDTFQWPLPIDLSGFD